MKLVGLVSSYREGRLVQGAVRSLLEADCDQVYVLEGPAGDPLEGEMPDTDLGSLVWAQIGSLTEQGYAKLSVERGRWRTDARKRQAMLERAQEDWRGAPAGDTLWGVIVDADEVLMNAQYLRDWLLRLDYHEQVDPEAEYLGRPMRIMELDGSLSWVRGRLLRLDRVVEYKVSTSVFTVRLQGKVETFTNAGNVPDLGAEYWAPRQAYLDEGRMVVWPPLPTEPYLVHRSMLRHPNRSGLRLHEQERDELRLAGMKVDE